MEEVEEGDAAAGPKAGAAQNRKMRLRLPKFGKAEEDPEETREPMDRMRWWELTFSIRGFENVTVETLKLFWTVSLGSENPKKHRNRDACLNGRLSSAGAYNVQGTAAHGCCELRSAGGKWYSSEVRLQTKFSSIFTLEKGKVFTADNPILMYERKTFGLSYKEQLSKNVQPKELDKHVVKVDMWRVSCWTFNEYFGLKKQKLSLIANRDPNMELRILRKLSRKQMADKKKAKSVADVALYRCTVNLEEIFDFDLFCENWTLELRRASPEYTKMKEERKRLTFTMPRDRRTLPGQRRYLGRGAASQTVEWNQQDGRFFWPSCGKFVFRGTRTHLQNSYFIVSVLTGKPPAFLADNATVQRLEKHAPAQPHRVLGRCLLNLTSVLDMSVFQGKVKRFTADHDRYIVGDINGNVKCILRSKGMKEPELDFRTNRPEQLKTATTVSHLNRYERYLVVRIKKCEALPVADFDTSSSDPYLRCTWDNMVMLSPVVKQSLRPVFNQSFYFPVRVVFPEMRMGSKAEKKHQDTILKYELTSKGFVQIQVWDDDVTSADCLGGCQVTLGDILNVRATQKRTLLGPLKSEKKDDDEEENELEEKQERHNQWYEEPRSVRVYDGSKTALGQSALANKDAALIHFEAYFYPDWAETLRFEDEVHEADTESVWAKKEEEWTIRNRQKAEDYALPFPDSIGAKRPKEESMMQTADSLRRFPCIGLHPLTRVETPLMAFVSPIIVPEEWSFPAKMLEWVHCLSFEITQRQARTGLIPTDGWKDPEYVLARRKGAPQDHSVLLCSLLLGCKEDAYVVKGTVYSKDPVATIDKADQLIEHTWVMTRHKGWVTFWEPCSRQIYHLPNRYDPKKARRRKTEHTLGKEDDKEEDEEEEEQDEDTNLEKQQWEGEAEDSRVHLEDMESLPTVGRMPKPKMRSDKGKKKDEEPGRERLKRELVEQREGLLIAPKRKMLQEDTLVTWLPYDSIEVVFNDKNAWANRQNHHPACISYESCWQFEGLISETSAEHAQPSATTSMIQTQKALRGNHSSVLMTKRLLKESFAHVGRSLHFQPICPNVSVQPELRPSIIDELQDDLRAPVAFVVCGFVAGHLVVRLAASQRSHLEELMHQLRLFLEIQELWRQIDPDSPAASRVLEGYREIPNDYPREQMTDQQKCIAFVLCSSTLLARGPSQLLRYSRILNLRVWNRHGSPFFDSGYKDYAKEQDRLWKSLERLCHDFQKKEDSFPIKRGKKFSGLPVHFCTSDQESIRQYLMEINEYKQIIDTDEEDVFYTIECRILGRLGGVLSVWLYVGIQEPQRETDFDEEL
ncbi:DRC7 [Symbiodinium sp. CCMP2456]|nr:DRC7 [Symbiodinium sp. CCMP2456]